MKTITNLWLVLVLLLTGCSSSSAPNGPVVVPTPSHGAGSQPNPEPSPPPNVSAPDQGKPSRRAPVITLDQAFTRVRGVPEVVEERNSLQERLVLVQMDEDEQFYHISVGENRPERIRFFLHFRVDKFDGSVFVSESDGKLRKVEPITVTAQDALKRVRELPAVVTYRPQVGDSFRDEMTADLPEEFRVQIGQQTTQGVSWTHTYLVSKVDLSVQEERVWPTEGTVPIPVTGDQALALVERLKSVQALKAEVGVTYRTDLASLPDGTYQVRVGMMMPSVAGEKTLWRLTFYVEKATGRVLSREIVA
jgi:hypothetical protein